MQRTAVFIVAAILAIAGTAPGLAQDNRRAPDLGSETGNFGLAPFTSIPTYTLTDAQKAEVRAFEDRQLQERRALEDQFAADIKALLVRQAQERAALMTAIEKQR